MGPQEDYIETVFTCEGDINDPNLQSRLEDFRRGLRDLLSTDKRKLILKKVEPWNSVRVTFNIPREAASRLKQLAQQGNTALRQLGVLAVQIEGDQLISLTIAGRNNEPTRLFFHTSDTVDAPSVSVIDSGGGSEFQSPGPSNAETTKKNIENYLRQQGAPIFDSLFGQSNAASDVLRNSGESSGQSGPFSALNAPNSVGANPLQGPQVALGRNPGYPSPVSFMGTGSANSDSIGHPGLKLNSPSEVAGQPLQNELSLPPPPPYPHGSAMLNNYAKAAASRFGGTSTTSPLLVNLLQNEPSLAGINNFINNKMLPPPEASPPPKKKRKPRKPKDKINKPVESQSMAMHPGFPSNPGTSGEVEISIQSVPNPALTPSVASCGGVPLVTSGSSSNMPTIPMVTQALPATTQPAVTYSSQGRQPGHLPPSPTHPEVAGLHVVTTATKIPSSQDPSPRISESGDFSPFLPENTAGKIINPYTGLLEPMDNSSDTSPNKSDSSLDGFSPHKSSMRRSPMEKKLQSTFTTNMSSVNNTFHQGQVKSDWISSVPTTASGIPEQTRQPQTQTMSSYKSGDDSNLLMPSLNLPVTSTGVRNVQSSQRKEFSLPVTSLQSIPPQVNKTQTDFLHGIQPSIDFVSRSSSDCVSRQTNYTAVNSTVDLMNVSRTSAYSSNVPFGNVVGTTSALSMAASDKLPGLSTAPKVTQQFQPLYRSVHKSVTSSLTSAYDDMDSTSVCFSTSQTTSVSNTHPSVSHKQQQPAVRQQQKTVSKPAELSSPNSSTNSEHLLNPHVMNHPAKNSSIQLHHGSNREVDSPGGDSENSSQSSLLHDQQAQNDVTPLEAETKVYNHDSGIGSSSERSDGTPSEPGDDFKSGHTNHSDECGIKPFLDGVNKSCIPKSDSQVITVGYAMSNSHMLKDGLTTDILSMTKTLNHSTFNNSNCHKDKTKIMNNIDPSHQVTVLHWSTKDKILSNQIESNKRKSPKQFLRDDSLSQVMSGKQPSPYTTEHLQHMQNLMKLDALQSQAVEYAHQYGDNRPKIGGKANVDFSGSTKRDENTNRRSPFSSLAHQSEVARASPLHMVNNHIQGRGSPRINDSVGRVSPRINDPLPRVSVSQVEDMFNKCNNDHSIPQLIHPASRPSSVMSSMNQGSIQAGATTAVSTQNYSYVNQKLFPRTTHSDKKAKSPVNVGNSTAPLSGNVRMSNMENGPLTLTTSLTNSRMTTGKNQTSTVGSGVQNRLQDSNYCQANCDDDVSIVSVSQVSKTESCALKTTTSSGLDQQKPMSSLSLTTPSSSVQYNKRRSPVNSSMNSLTQHFFDPALPLAKRLTESVQKLVKPLPSINLSSLPHSQHKPAVGITSVAKSSAVSSPPRIVRDNKQNLTDSMYANIIPPSTDILSYSHPESVNADDHVSGVIHSGPENNHTSLQESVTQCSANNYISDHPDRNYVDPPNMKSIKLGEKQVNSNSDIVQSTMSSNTKSASDADNLKQVSSERTSFTDTTVQNKLNVKGTTQSQHTSVDTMNCAQNECNKSAWNDLNDTSSCHSSSQTPQQHNPQISLNGPTTLNSEEKKIESNLRLNKSTVGAQDPSLSAQLFDKVDSKSFSDGIGKVLTTENGSQGEGVVKVITALEDTSPSVNVFNPKTENINDSETQKQVNLSDSKPSTDAAQLSDESPTTMALRRTRKLSESSENLNTTPPQHNLRQTRQRVNPSETEKDTPKPPGTDTEASKNLRTSRRRKTIPNDVEGLSLEISKKTDEPEVAKHTRSADVKDNAILPPLIVKNDVARTSLDNPELMENVKSGLRNRTQNKVSIVEDKGKSSHPKDLKRKMIIPEDDKKMQQNKRSRHSPTLSQDKLVNASRDKSPVRGSRTRGQTPQNIETQEEKRSTRSSKPKDATETLPPSNKRRRSSRDHR